MCSACASKKTTGLFRPFARGYFAITDGKRLSPQCTPANSIFLLPSLDELLSKVLVLKGGVSVVRFEPLGATHSFVVSTDQHARVKKLVFTHRDHTVSAPCAEAAHRLVTTIEQMYGELATRFVRENPSSWVFDSLRKRLDEMHRALCS